MALTPCNLSNQHTLQYICSKNQLKKLLQTQADFVFNHTQAKDKHSCEHLMRRAIFSNFLRITPPTGSKGTEGGAGGLPISVPPAAGGRRAIVDGIAELVQHVLAPASRPSSPRRPRVRGAPSRRTRGHKSRRSGIPRATRRGGAAPRVGVEGTKPVTSRRPAACVAGGARAAARKAREHKIQIQMEGR